MQVLKSHAKINLFLHICDRRDDGYHILESMVTILPQIYDNIYYDPYVAKTEVRFSGQFAYLVNDTSSNTVINAINIMKSLFPEHNINIGINVEKNIPVGSGLGGGSSNAAMLIKLINYLYNLQLSCAQMQRIGNSIGADVALFLSDNLIIQPRSKSIYMTGIGDIIMDCNLKFELNIILIYPNIISTSATIYKNFDKEFSDFGAINIDHNNNIDIIDYLANKKNDLSDIAIKLQPNLQIILDEISKLPNCYFARMSGSGSVCFGVFESQDQALSACVELKNKFPNWWICYGTAGN